MLETKAWATKLLRESLAFLSSDEVPYPTPLQRSVLLMLKRWGRTDAEMRTDLLASGELSAWEEGDNPVQQEFAADLRFELEEYLTTQ